MNVHGSPTSPIDLNLLHKRLAHLHVDGIRQFLKQQGITVPASSTFIPCDACSMAKSTRIICRIPHSRAIKLFQKIHVDLCGKIIPTGIGNKLYFILFTDDYSRYRWVMCLTTKDQSFTMIRQFFISVENQYSSFISEIHSDNGIEFGGKLLEDLLTSKGCKFIPTAPYHHHQNGIAERSHGVITEKARAMIIGSKLPRHLWPEAI